MAGQQMLLDVTDENQTPELHDVFPFTLVSEHPVTYTLAGLHTIHILATQNAVLAMTNSSMGDVAGYDFDDSSITLGFSEFGTVRVRARARKALLLHECIHAMQDNRPAPWMRKDTSEAAAYIAQCLFHRECGTRRSELTDLAAAAWDATELIRASADRSVTENDISNFMTEIRTHDLYRRVYSNRNFAMGITRPTPRPPAPRACTVSAVAPASQVQLLRILGW